jgi:hypothetical protein
MIRLPLRRPIRVFYLFADVALAMSLLALVGVYVLWSLGHRPGGFERHIGNEDSQSRLMICSRDNRLIVALYAPSYQSYFRRFGQGSVNQLLDDDEAYIAADLFSWGFASPHWVIALVLSAVPAWWVLTRHRRLQDQIRQSESLCRSCGYDIRASDTRCPECGDAVPALALRRPATSSGSAPTLAQSPSVPGTP